MKIDRALLQERWYNTEESDEKCVLNELIGLSWGLDSTSLKCSYEFIMLNLSLERRKEHWKLFYKTVLKQCKQNHVYI